MRGWRTGFGIPDALLTGVTIKDCLVENDGRIYPYAAWNFYRKRITEDEKFGKEYTGTYQSFYRYFYILENLGVIRKSGPPQHGKGRIPRQYYELVDERFLEDEFEQIWRHPQQLLYPTAGLGREKYNQMKEEAKAQGLDINEYITTDEIAMKDVDLEDIDSTLALIHGDRDFSGNIVEHHRTLPYVRAPKLDPEVVGIQKELKDTKEDLELCLSEATKPQLESSVENVLNAILDLIETGDLSSLKGITSDILIVADQWRDIPEYGRQFISDAISKIPDEMIELTVEIDNFEMLVEVAL